MQKQALPAVSEVTSANHDEFSKADKIVVVAYFDESDAKNREAFDKFAESHRDEYLFGRTSDPAAISAAGVTAPAVALYKTFDEGRNDLAGSWSGDDLAAFVKDNAIPLLDEISPDNFALYAEANVPLAYVFIEANDPNRETLTKSLESVAREHKGKVNFVWIDALKFSDHAKSLNLGEPKWPAFAIQKVAEGLKYPLDQAKNVDLETVRDFVGRFVKGEVPASVKSQPVPKSQDESVYVLVADEFDKVALDDSKDVFVEFYAPWYARSLSHHIFLRLLTLRDAGVGTASVLPQLGIGWARSLPTTRSVMVTV
jgi:protein disulfide-isomerase A1